MSEAEKPDTDDALKNFAHIEQLWSLLEDALETLEELCIVYLEKGEDGRNANRLNRKFEAPIENTVRS